MSERWGYRYVTGSLGQFVQRDGTDWDGDEVDELNAYEARIADLQRELEAGKEMARGLTSALENANRELAAERERADAAESNWDEVLPDLQELVAGESFDHERILIKRIAKVLSGEDTRYRLVTRGELRAMADLATEREARQRAEERRAQLQDAYDLIDMRCEQTLERAERAEGERDELDEEVARLGAIIIRGHHDGHDYIHVLREDYEQSEARLDDAVGLLREAGNALTHSWPDVDLQDLIARIDASAGDLRGAPAEGGEVGA